MKILASFLLGFVLALCLARAINVFALPLDACKVISGDISYTLILCQQNTPDIETLFHELEPLEQFSESIGPPPEVQN